MGFNLIYILQEALGSTSLAYRRFETVFQKTCTVLKLFQVAVFRSEIRWTIEIRNIAREWFPLVSSGIALLTEPLLFETARPTALVHTLDQRLDQIVDLGLMGHVQLLEASLHLRFTILLICLTVLKLLLFHYIVKIRFNWAWVHNLRGLAKLLAQLLMEHHRVGQNSSTAVIRVSLLPAHLASAQI